MSLGDASGGSEGAQTWLAKGHVVEGHGWELRWQVWASHGETDVHRDGGVCTVCTNSLPWENEWCLAYGSEKKMGLFCVCFNQT